MEVNGTRVEVTPTPANPAFEQPTAQIQELTEKLKAAADVMQEAKTEDAGRWQSARDEFEKLGKQIEELREAKAREDREKATADTLEQMNRFLAEQKAPSKAHLVGGNIGNAEPREQGGFIAAVMAAKSNDHEAQTWGKAQLKALGSGFQESWGKATLGTSDAAGGFIIPNAIVDSMLRPTDYNNKFRNLLTVVSGVNISGVDMPYRDQQLHGTSAASIAPWGDTKDNRDLVYGGYTATMYTLAAVYDISKQLARKSGGAAEADVMAELRDAFGRGEASYVINGTGSSQPYGLTTALDTAPGFTSSFSAAATLAGSVTSALATAAGALASRNVDNVSAMMNAADYWLMLRQGADDAGYYFNTVGSSAIPGVPTGTLVSPFRIPIYPDTILASPRLIVGDFSKLKLWLGDAFRIDTSDQAGSRWDKNLIGFRGEMELGFDARPAVYSGAFENIADITP